MRRPQIECRWTAKARVVPDGGGLQC